MRNELDFFRGLTPMRNFLSVQHDMNRLFSEMFPEVSGEEEIEFTPAVDIEETDDKYVMYFDLPGVKKEDVKIELLDNRLIVSGERREEKEINRKNRYSFERHYGTFERTFALPTTVDSDKVDAMFDNGVLKVTVPKVETAKARQININEGKAGTLKASSGAQTGGVEIKKDQKTAGVNERRAAKE